MEVACEVCTGASVFAGEAAWCWLLKLLETRMGVSYLRRDSATLLALDIILLEFKWSLLVGGRGQLFLEVRLVVRI